MRLGLQVSRFTFDGAPASTGATWRAIARDTAWKDYSGKTELSATLMKSAQEVAA